MIKDKILAEQIGVSTKGGYWSVGSFYFFDKVECLQFATATGKQDHIRFHLYDSAYESIDWNTDCSQTMDNLYVERAKKIRETYDYVTVSFSGGADSSNILDTFYKNNLRVDEVICYYPLTAIEKLSHEFDPTDKGPDNLIFEYIMACEPMLKVIAKEHPETKITVLDYTNDSIEIVSNANTHALSMNGQSISPVFAGQRAVIRRLKEISEKINNVCCIVGAEKPKLLFRPSTGKFATYFVDFAYNFGKNKVDGYLPTIEHFYHSPDTPGLLHAQVTALKKILQPVFSDPENPLRKDLTLKVTPFGDLVLNNESDFFKRIIYKDFNPFKWQVKKTTSFFYQNNCAWIHSNLMDSRIHDIYDGQLKEYLYGVHPNLIIHENNRPSRFKEVMSNMYWL
jgi:hypothetical protein